MRNISFFLTTPQFKARTKHVTRRLGWKNAKPGDVLMAVEKGQGLAKGEKVNRLGQIRVTDVRQERLDAMLVHPYGKQECIAEGFPTMDGAAFVSMFCEHNGCAPSTVITRIAFDYL